MNFTEQQPGQRLNTRQQHQTKADQLLEVVVLELGPNSGANLIVMAAATEPEETALCQKRCDAGEFLAPKFQSLEAKEMIFLDDQQQTYRLTSNWRKEDKHQVELKPPKIWFQLGNPSVYPVKATLKCIDNKVVVELLGPDKTYDWTLHIQGTLYTGSYAR